MSFRARWLEKQVSSSSFNVSFLDVINYTKLFASLVVSSVLGLDLFSKDH